MSKKFSGRPFNLISTVQSGSPVAFARFVCGCCGNRLDFRVEGGKSINPEAVTKKAADKGWDVSPRSERVHCPTCIADRKARAPGESPKAETSVETPDVEEPKKIDLDIPRPLTAEDRLKIRNALDMHFDDAKGRYLDGYSDWVVADKLAIPRIHVETIREAAYGPLREDPVISALRQDLQAHRAAVEAMREQFERDLKVIRGKIDATASLLESVSGGPAKAQRGAVS